MFHYFGTVTNTRGDSLAGWSLEVRNGDAVVPIYSDDNATPLPNNRAVTDAAGNADFYVADGVYSLRYYDLSNVLQRTEQNVVMRALLEYPVSPEALPISTAQQNEVTRATGVPKTTDLSRTGLNAQLALGGKTQVPDGIITMDSNLLISASNTQLVMSRGAFLMPGSASLTLCRLGGSAPTSWTALAQDVPARTEAVPLPSEIAAVVGDWVEFRSNALVSGPNSQGVKKGALRKITGATGGTYTLNEPLRDAFLVSDGATVGKPVMVENVVIDGLQANREDFDTLIGFGLRIDYAAHVKIIAPAVYGSKVRNGADRSSNVPTGIKVGNAYDVEISGPTIGSVGWYAIEFLGIVDHVRVWGGLIEDARHGVEASNWSGIYGEPTDILIDGAVVKNTNLACFSTHDVGRDIVFRDTQATGARTDVGYLVRSANVLLDHVTARGNFADGFYAREAGSGGWKIVNSVFENNGRAGINSDMPGEVFDSIVRGHIGPQSGVRGISMPGGKVRGGGIYGTVGIAFGIPVGSVSGGQQPLIVEGVDLPSDAAQTTAFFLSSGLAYSQVDVRNCNLSGYASNKLFTFSTAQPVDRSPPQTSGNLLASRAASRVEATLTAGRAQISSAAIKSVIGQDFATDVVSNILLERKAAAKVIGALFVDRKFDGGAVIKSTSYQDPTSTNVIRNNSGQGAVVGPIGSTGARPTNWSDQGNRTTSGMALDIVGAGVAAGPTGQNEDYVDLRYYGTTTQAASFGMYLDTQANPAAAATKGQTWSVSSGLQLVAGSLAGVSPLLVLTVRGNAGATVRTVNNPASIASNPARRSATYTIVDDAAAFLQPAVGFQIASGVTVDFTVRVFLPQLEQQPEATAPIRTTGAAATRTQNPDASDGSTIVATIRL